MSHDGCIGTGHRRDDYGSGGVSLLIPGACDEDGLSDGLRLRICRRRRRRCAATTAAAAEGGAAEGAGLAVATAYCTEPTTVMMMVYCRTVTVKVAVKSVTASSAVMTSSASTGHARTKDITNTL